MGSPHVQAAGPPPVFYRASDLKKMLGISNTWLWGQVKNGGFPKPVRLSARRVAWRVEDIDAWVAERVAGRDAA